MPIPELPIEVLSHITALISPPFHPPQEFPSTPPPLHILQALDPHPGPSYTSINTIAAFSRSSHSLLEASRPWLWEHVDVRSGRGWLAVVNALTEEVNPVYQVEEESAKEAIEAIVHKDIIISSQPVQAPLSPISPPEHLQPLPAEDAHVQPNTVPGGYGYYPSGTPDTPTATYHSNPFSTPLPNFYSSLGVHVPYNTSPPQPPAAVLLLTPPGSRGGSPRPDLTRQMTITADNHGLREASPASSASTGSGSPHPGLARHNTITAAFPTYPPSSLAASKAAAIARLRGRSRSPRRSVGFDTEGISAVLDRSRSASAHGSSRLSAGTWPKRIPLERRRSSLSRARTIMDRGYEEDDEDEQDEEDDVVMPLSPSQVEDSPLRSYTPSDFGSTTSNCNPELLPPPGPYIRHLSFNNFKTIGSGRTQDEAVRGRFVTAGRLEGVIKNCPNLISVCMTEYVDSSLSFAVIEDLLFRGYRRPRGTRRMSVSNTLTRQRSLSVDPNPAFSPMTTTSQLDPPRPEYVPYEDENEEERWTRRGMFTALQALDLTGCVSHVFTNAMREFCLDYLDPDHDDTEDERGRTRHRPNEVPSSTEDEDDLAYKQPTKRSNRRTPRFSAMQRLSLRACTTLDPPILHDLVLVFPNLTHLDISNTRAPTSLIVSLTEAPPRNMRLQSLSLARCPRLDPTAIVNFLVLSTATRDLVELNLYMNPSQANTIITTDLDRLLTAPCIKSGKLRYLDLSSTGMTEFHLHPAIFPAQPRLLSFGLSHIPTLDLRPIADFLMYSAPNVEILTLAGTAFNTALSARNTSIQTTMELHAQLINPLTTVPFSLASLSLNSPSMGPDLRPGATRLRVIELSGPVRRLIADGGSGEWKVIKSKGGRGWYVDLSAGWIDDPETPVEGDAAVAKKFVRHLPSYHPRRQWLSSLAAAGGRVGSAVGWHSRKMEVVRGMGMLGREEGMAGVGGFAFDEA